MVIRKGDSDMKKYMILLFLGLFVSCSSNEPIQMSQDDWLPIVSRADGTEDAKEYLVTLKYDNTSSEGTLVASTTSSWKNNRKPMWPNDNTLVDVIALHPAPSTLPDELGDDKIYTMHHSKTTSSNKPNQFIMHHLMAQLKIHILIHEEQVHIPYDGIIHLRRKGTIEYSGEEPCLDASSYDIQKVTLGVFSKVTTSDDGTSAQSSEWHDDDFENTPMTVVPQTFKSGEDCVTFKVENVTYVFKPEEDIKLTPGKINVLWLGVTYSEPEVDENGNSSSGIGSTVSIVKLEAITVADWLNGGNISGGKAEEI